MSLALSELSDQLRRPDSYFLSRHLTLSSRIPDVSCCTGSALPVLICLHLTSRSVLPIHATVDHDTSCQGSRQKSHLLSLSSASAVSLYHAPLILTSPCGLRWLYEAPPASATGAGSGFANFFPTGQVLCTIYAVRKTLQSKIYLGGCLSQKRCAGEY